MLVIFQKRAHWAQIKNRYFLEKVARLALCLHSSDHSGMAKICREFSSPNLAFSIDVLQVGQYNSKVFFLQFSFVVCDMRKD